VRGEKKEKRLRRPLYGTSKEALAQDKTQHGGKRAPGRKGGNSILSTNAAYEKEIRFAMF